MITESAAPARDEFQAPGPGSWALDPVHFPRPMTRYWTEVHPEPFRRGYAEFARFYGMLFDGVEMAYVNGIGYGRMRPLPDAEVPERLRRADEVWAGRRWREHLEEWDTTCKPRSIAVHRELQSIDIDALEDTELVAYLRRCRDHHAAMIRQHMRFTGAVIVPTGDLLAHAMEWTGLPQGELLAIMQGSAPVSAGASAELEALVRLANSDPQVEGLLASDGDAAEILACLRSLPGEAGETVAAYLDLVGYRLLDGFDISGRFALELPDALLRAIRVAVESGGPADADVEAREAAVRDRVPEDRREEFDALLAEARVVYRLRDERGVFSDIWASGIMRRAVLGAGRRLAARGRLHAPDHLIEAGIDEMAALLEDGSGPSADELAERARLRASFTAKDAPPALGDPPTPPPDPSRLPPAAARVMQATGIVVGAMFASSEAVHDADLLRGIAASGGSYEGPARRVAGPAEFGRIQRGDVLVTEATSEAFNILLPLLGAIVTDNGGALSHAAIVAREYGIPGVVGTREATERIPDGARVRVDGETGEVEVLA